MTKAGVCRELGVERMVEDGLHYATDCAENGIPTLLLNSPWNQAESLHEGITRVYSWAQILENLIS